MVLLDFAVDSIVFKVPFLVTKEKITNPIIGYNIIEHLVLNFKAGTNLLPSMVKILPCLSVENAQSMVLTIEKAAEVS